MTSQTKSEPQYIDMTPTWGELGNMLFRFVYSDEHKVVRALEPEIQKALAAAQALLAIQDTLTPEQKAKVNEVVRAECKKQGLKV